MAPFVQADVEQFVRRVNSPTDEETTHPLTGRELRALRRHQRESTKSPLVFVSERSAGRDRKQFGLCMQYEVDCLERPAEPNNPPQPSHVSPEDKKYKIERMYVLPKPSEIYAETVTCAEI
jgi:hypothetical protein